MPLVNLFPEIKSLPGNQRNALLKILDGKKEDKEDGVKNRILQMRFMKSNGDFPDG